MHVPLVCLALLLAPALALAQAQIPPAPNRRDSGSIEPDAGIAEALATDRAARISNVRYELAFDIPAERTSAIDGRVVVRFALKDPAREVVLDFAPAATATTSVAANGRASDWSAVNGHIVIPAGDLREGENEITIAFRAGDASLNRNDEFMYTLFVPARAHLAFPCFDQPSLKGRYTLTLTMPRTWEVVANGAEAGREPAGERVIVRFAETKPLPTYLFAFAAGRFSVETAERDGRTFRMFHRETDTAKVARNRDAVFDLHARALAWLEEYTGIPYPWGKFDFVLIPSFQFGGMEHAGAILYNAASVLLEESATVNQQLGRASLISHETSHMWFGDLVTMRWFDDVWTKEVFANFMAAKIVNPSFPQVNHELRFLLSNYPSAYAVDRTAGANAVRQHLTNLNEAGSLYGAIIYQKAPIVMRNLEAIMGEAPFRDGLREYLRTYSFANATWPELIAILDGRTDEDLRTWSHAWVEEPGRPIVRTELTMTGDRIGALMFTQADPRGRGLLWNQQLRVTLGYADGEKTVPVHLAGASAGAPDAQGLARPLFVLPNGGGIAYGQMELDAASRSYLLEHLAEIRNPLTRGSAWVTLWDELLRGVVPPRVFIELALTSLPRESNELNTQQVLGYLRTAYWQFIAAGDRLTLATRVERSLREGLAAADAQSLKSAYFRTYRDTALTPDGIAWLTRVWRRQEAVPGLTLAEVDDIAMALEIAVRGLPGWHDVLNEQLARTGNPDRKARFAFVMPALDADPAVRDRFFASLADAGNRSREPWATEGLAYLNHPLRAASGERYIRPSLDLLREIQQTGDIFFPKNWTDAVLSGHASPAAASIVRAFLASLPATYPPRLKMVVEASADDLFRAADLRR